MERKYALYNTNVFKFWLSYSLISALMYFILRDDKTNDVVSKQMLYDMMFDHYAEIEN